MSRFNIPGVARGLTTYAIERQHGFERHQPNGLPLWAEQRRFWTDAILQGMARLEGRQPDPELMEQFDLELEQSRGCYFFVPAAQQMQKDVILELRHFVAALEATGDDRRRQIAVVGALLEDMATYRSWGWTENGLSSAREEAESALVRMTAQMPIRFTRILLGGDVGPHWTSGFVPGAVTDAGIVKQTSVYQEAVRKYPEVTDWPALCTVYVGRGLPSALGTVDASDFDLNIMNRTGDRFLKAQGVHCVGGPYPMTIAATPEVTAPEKAQTEEPQTGEKNQLLLGSRPLEPDDLEINEHFSSDDGCLTFCLDLLAEEKTVFGRHLSSEQKDSYVMIYAVYDEATGQVRDTLDVELRLPHDAKWFHCRLSPEVANSLKQKMDAFCAELYGERLPDPQPSVRVNPPCLRWDPLCKTTGRNARWRKTRSRSSICKRRRSCEK